MLKSTDFGSAGEQWRWSCRRVGEPDRRLRHHAAQQPAARSHDLALRKTWMALASTAVTQCAPIRSQAAAAALPFPS